MLYLFGKGNLIFYKGKVRELLKMMLVATLLVVSLKSIVIVPSLSPQIFPYVILKYT